MVLNLDRIAVDPHFRSYWIQRNITWTSQFRAAAADLTRHLVDVYTARISDPPPTGAARALS